MSKPPPLLMLWDIDHTLVDTNGVGRRLYARAFESVFGRPLTELADMAGRTERAIITETLALNGLDPDIPLDAFFAALEAAADTLRDQMRDQGRALPGAAGALRGFSAPGAGPGTVQSVVTGNIRGVATAKLDAYELLDFIDMEAGGFGDDGSDRAVLVRSAIARAEAKYGLGFTAQHAVVVGDTPHDIKGALDNNAVAVGVATGLSSLDALTAAGAHLVLPDLRDLSGLHELLRARRTDER